MSIVTEKCVKGSATDKVRKLKKADNKLHLFLSHKGRQSIVVTRFGNTELLPISKRVAEELLAAGFGWEG